MERKTQIDLCWRIVEWAAKQGESSDTDPRKAKRVQPILDGIDLGRRQFLQSAQIPFLPDRKIGKLALPRGCSLMLEPDDKGNWKLPVLRVYHDQVDGHEVIRFQVGLFMENHGRDEHAPAVVAIGLRFETPEGKTGKHAYHHAQLCHRFKDENTPFPGCPEWLPDQHPAIPIDADGPLSLLIALLKSLYGNTFLRKLQHNTDLWEEIRGAANDGGSLRRLCASA